MLNHLTNYTKKDRELGEFRHLESVLLSLSIGLTTFLGIYLSLSGLSQTSQFVIAAWLVLSIALTSIITFNVIIKDNEKRFSRIRDGVKLTVFIVTSFFIYSTLLVFKIYGLKLITLRNISMFTLFLSLIVLAITDQKIEDLTNKYFKKRFPILYRRWND